MKTLLSKKIQIGIVAFCLLEVLFFFFADRPLAFFAGTLKETAPTIAGFFSSITDFGKSDWYLWPCGLATLFCAFLTRGKSVPVPYRRLYGYIGVRALFIFSTVAISGIVANIIKPIVGRARPSLLLRDGTYGIEPLRHFGYHWNSMPSGHATTAFALAFSLSFLYPRLKPLWLLYGLALAASRVIVDAHYLSDVCAGSVLGWLTVRLFLKYGMNRVGKVIFPIDNPLTKR